MLIIDEPHAAKRSDLGARFNAVQHVIQDPIYPPPLMLIRAGLPDVRGIATISAQLDLCVKRSKAALRNRTYVFNGAPYRFGLLSR